MADGGASIFLIVSALASTGASMYAQKAGEDAANAQSKSQQNLLERKQSNQRQALVENTKRLARNKERQLAMVRLSQSASGFNTNAGTPLAVFGDIESGLDDEINETTSRALDAIGTTKSQAQNLRTGDKWRAHAGGIERMAIGVEGVSNYASAYAGNYDRSGQDPWSVYS